MRNDISVIHHGWQNELSYMPYRAGFFGQCFGVILYDRGPDDPHILWAIVVEDDEAWHHPPSSGGGSTAWFPDLLTQIHAAEAWMKENCEDDYGGYKFKEKA